MFGQENRTHAPFAQQGEQPILTEKKPFVFALQQLFSLPTREFLRGHQRVGNRTRIVQFNALLLELLTQPLETIRLDQAASLNDGHKRVGGEFQCHDNVIPLGTPLQFR